MVCCSFGGHMHTTVFTVFVFRVCDKLCQPDFHGKQAQCWGEEEE